MEYIFLSIRPYQLMCIVCKIGEGFTSDLKNKRLNEILKNVRKNPDIPVTLRCNVEGIYQYQNPGKDEDTPEGKLFNIKRDLDILQRMGLVPGSTRPARELFRCLLKNITTTKGICIYGKDRDKVWEGCPKAETDFYESGCAKGIEAIFSPRSENEKNHAKKESSKLMYNAEKLLIRPHHLLCMTCFHKGREKLAPIKEDNLFEAIDIIQKNPDIPITLKQGCCMICTPCSSYNSEIDCCTAGNGMGLRDQKKDLDVLQKLNLKYGDTIPAKKLFKLLFDKIHSTKEICGWEDGIVRAPEWSVCDGRDNYARGRKAGLGFLDVIY